MIKIDEHVTICDANLETLKNVYEIDQELFQQSCYSYEAWLEMFQNHNYEIKTINYDNEVAGFLCLWHGLDEDEIILIGIAKQFQGKKLGTYLMNYALDTTKKVMLEVSSINEKAINLYQKLGFKIVAKRNNYYRDGSDAIIMEKNAV